MIDLMKQALEALETVFMPHHPAVINLRTAIEQAEKQEPVAWPSGTCTVTTTTSYEAPLQQEKQEPVAWVEQDAIDWLARDERGKGAYTNTALYKRKDKWAPVPLYTAPPQRQPLTKEEINDLWMRRDCRAAIQAGDLSAQLFWFVRAIERAHGIGGGE